MKTKEKPIHESKLSASVIAVLSNAREPMKAKEVLTAIGHDVPMNRLANLMTQLTNANRIERSGSSGRYKYALAESRKIINPPPMRPLSLNHMVAYRRSSIQDAPSLTVERHREQMRNKLRVESVYNRQAAD